MFLLHQPSARDVERFLEASRGLPQSYAPPGIAAAPPPGFRLDEQTVEIGQGDAAFARACDALRAWRQFDVGWAHLYPRGAATTPGTVVAVAINHLGFWSLNGCRLLYPVADRDASVFGYAYGTLTNHAESGEEVFSVSLSRATGRVTYTLRAVSKPRAALAWLGYPVALRLQAQFRRDSGAAMQRAVRRTRR